MGIMLTFCRKNEEEESRDCTGSGKIATKADLYRPDLAAGDECGYIEEFCGRKESVKTMYFIKDGERIEL